MCALSSPSVAGFAGVPAELEPWESLNKASQDVCYKTTQAASEVRDGGTQGRNLALIKYARSHSKMASGMSDGIGQAENAFPFYSVS